MRVFVVKLLLGSSCSAYNVYFVIDVSSVHIVLTYNTSYMMLYIHVSKCPFRTNVVLVLSV